MVHNSYSRNVQIDQQYMPLYKTYSHEMRVQHEVFWYGQLSAVTAIFVTWPDVTTRNYMHFCGWPALD